MRVLAALEKKLLLSFAEKIAVRESARLSSKRLSHGAASASTTSVSPDGPLSGVRIIDLTRVLAGPFATMVLSDLGAEVIKVEHPQKGDETRGWGPPFAGTESCYFLSVNRNKQSIGIDLKKAEGLSVIHDLAKHSDVLIENFIPGALDRIGLGYDALKSIAPQLIYCTISGYGPSGPYHRRPGYDVIAASVGGLVGVTGPEDGEPCKVGVAMTDLATGLYAHGAIMAALLDRQKTGNGQKIDCNLLSTQISCMVNLASNYLNGDKEAKRWGTAHESIVPYQAFPTSDGYLTIGSGNNDQFAALCKALDLINLLDDERYATNALRVKHRDSLLATLKERFQQKTTNEWLNTLEGAPFPYGPINTVAQAFSDPQVIHNEMVQTVHHPTVGMIKQVAPPVSYSSSQNKIRSAPPVLGQHTKYVLSEILGYSDCKIEQLIEQGAVASSKDLKNS
ncbi:succinate--hydroxymethylglutarate CoA-transferase-like isoform X2 [Penaeus japonicus]|uniref:succinate--hydroxymethylglutarate CoA-transferase-like isoform X2 n=1 Tax=Penaeus japonicus TaxID=27405 RepID=UPI001C715C41|nr:succinate--hydroxymethylglutarate CoA-transferase-like isoform X2 [Penaeus japonicus]